MKKTLFLILILIGFLRVDSQNLIINFENGKRFFTCHEYNNCADNEDIQFAKVMKWAILRGQKQRDGIENIDFYSRTLVTPFSWENDNLQYSCKLQIQVTSSQLVFTFFDIVSQELEGLKAILGTGKQDFNKLNPEKKTKHKMLQDMFISQAKQVIVVAINSINYTKVQISDWNGVINGRLQKGMTLDEAYLIYGKPYIIHNRDNESQADFNAFTHVLFRNNIVVKIF